MLFESIKKKKINFILFLFIGVIFVICLLNKFPDGYTYDNADANQCVDCAKYAVNLLGYTWQPFSAGNANISYPYFLLIYFFNLPLKIFGAKNISFFYYFFFFLGSFFSFRFSLKILKGKIDEWIADLLSFLYAFWPFLITYYLSFYFGFLLIYALIPIVFSLSARYILDKKLFNKYLSGLGIFFFILAIGYGNASFFIAFNLFFIVFIILIFLFFFHWKDIFLFTKKVTLLYFVYFLASFIFIIPQIPILIHIADNLNSSTAQWSLGGWILMSAMPLTQVIFMIPNVDWSILIFSVASLIPGLVLFSILISFFYWKTKSANERRIYLICSLMVIFTIFLSNKGKGYIDNLIIERIFTSFTFLSGIRSSDKTFFFLPFFLLFPAYILLKNSKRLKILFSVIIISSYVFFAPFLRGDMYLKYYGIESGKDFQTSMSTSIVKIPKEYLDISAAMSKNSIDAKIISLPWNAQNSIGWSNYPKWKMIGIDGTTHLFDQSTISVSSSMDGWFFIKDWNEENIENSKWILPFSGMLNSKYLIYHKDTDDKIIEQTLPKILNYEKEGLISEVFDNDYFTIYKINNKFYQPHFYTPDLTIFSQRSVKEIPRILHQTESDRPAIFFSQQNQQPEKNIRTQQMIKQNIDKDKTPVIEYKKINPTKYRIIIHNAYNSFPLIFSESYHPQWKMYLVNSGLRGQSPQLKYKKRIPDSYKMLDGNDDQATKEELSYYVKNGWISTFGDGKNKEITHSKWKNLDKEIDYIEKYNIGFISKNTKNTIQNENLPKGDFFETWFKSPVDNNKNHLIANGYANSWVIDPEKMCMANDNCVKNSDGSYNFEIVVEFWPQRLFYIGIFISGLTILFSLIHLIYNWRRKNDVTKYENI